MSMNQKDVEGECHHSTNNTRDANVFRNQSPRYNESVHTPLNICILNTKPVKVCYKTRGELKEVVDWRKKNYFIRIFTPHTNPSDIL